MPQDVAIKIRIQVEEATPLPRTGTLYAIRELARRAGVSAEMFKTWRFDFEDGHFVSVFVNPGTTQRIRFPQADPWFWGDLYRGTFRTSTAAWMHAPEERFASVTDFKIPYSSDDRPAVGRFFVPVGSDCVECPVDLPASTLLTLSRFEETLPVPRDAHGRFSAFSSVAWREGFLHRPIVDEYGIALAQALSYLLPGWTPEERHLRVKLGHDVDEIGVPFSVRSALGHTFRRRSPLATVRDFLALSTGAENTYQILLRTLVKLSRERGLDSAVYWKSNGSKPRESGYDPRHKQIRNLVAAFRDQAVEMGIHPGYETFESLEKLSADVSELREWLGERQVGGRQDFLRWSPQSWVHWNSLGLAYDASVGFADHIGFRAGTSYPYRPWLLSKRCEAELLEIPLLAMDSTLQAYMKLKPGQALARLRECVGRCRTVGGVFTLVWHNTKLMDDGYTKVYRTLLDELAGTDGYDWRAACNGHCWG
jgi:hypothetical protein